MEGLEEEREQKNKSCEEDGVKVFWIEVSRCRPCPLREMLRAVIEDLHTFLNDMRMPEEAVSVLLSFMFPAVRLLRHRNFLSVSSA